MSIGFFFEYNGAIMQLPVNPESFEVVTSGKNEITEVVKLGDINILRDIGLKSISLETFLPARNNYPFIRTSGNFIEPSGYIEFFERVQRDKNPLLFTITEVGINMKMSIESMNYSHGSDNDDVLISLDMQEYRGYSVRVVEVPPTPPRATSTSQSVTIGSTVIVNGRLHRDSFGAAPGVTERNATRKVNFIKPGRSHPYHVTLLDGGWRGWVTEGSVQVI